MSSHKVFLSVILVLMCVLETCFGQASCTLPNGTLIESGSSAYVDCNNCVCLAGNLACSSLVCENATAAPSTEAPVTTTAAPSTTTAAPTTAASLIVSEAATVGLTNSPIVTLAPGEELGGGVDGEGEGEEPEVEDVEVEDPEDAEDNSDSDSSSSSSRK